MGPQCVTDLSDNLASLGHRELHPASLLFFKRRDAVAVVLLVAHLNLGDDLASCRVGVRNSLPFAVVEGSRVVNPRVVLSDAQLL